MPDLTADTAGAILASERESSGLSVREVADALNLPMHTVLAIEAENWAELPAAVFTRGYFRAYARHLELDADAVMAKLVQTIEPETPVTLVPAQTNARQLARTPWLLGGGILTLLIGLAWFGFSSSDPESEGLSEEAAARLAAQIPEAVPETVLETEEAGAGQVAVEEATPSTPQSITEQATDTEQASSETRAADRPVVEAALMPEPTAAEETRPSTTTGQSAVPAIADPATVVANVRRLTPAGSEILEMSFSDQCWVEIKNSAGEKLYENLGRAGLKWRFEGEGPFQVLLGYATGVELSYNHEVVALVPHTRNNVARLVLGQ